ASPPGWPQPSSTSSTWAGSSWGTFSRTARITSALRSSGRHSTREPLLARPMGVRPVATMTASGIGGLLRSIGSGPGDRRGRIAGYPPVASRPPGSSLAVSTGRYVTCSRAPSLGEGRRRQGVDVGRCARPPGRDRPMEIAYTEEQQALKSELRAYYQNLLTPELEQELSHAGGIGPVVRRVVKQMGTDGWLG